jgi:hypothetical protein
MRRSLSRLALLALLAAGALVGTTPANGAIHEMVAAYCSGGDHGAIDAAGFLEPPGISDESEQNFAMPVRANGVVEFPLVTDAPAAKFPEGTDVRTLDVSQADHPSAEHCKALNP